MCDLDMDGRNDVEDGGWRKARKQHTCDACDEAIRSGDRYHWWRALYDGRWSSMKHCARCWEMVEVLVRSDFVSGGVVLTLDCGETWESASGREPPEHVADLAFWLPGEPLPTEAAP